MPLLYRRFVQTFQIGSKCTISFQGMIVFKYIYIFFKIFSIKFYIWKFNRIFSIGWVSPVKMATKVKKRGMKVKKNDTKIGIMQLLMELQQKVFTYS